jgi:flavin-dependent dehydrogenase
MHFGNNCFGDIKIKGGLVPLETAKKFAAKNVAVIGDAAGFVNPITGGGIH